MIEALRFEWVRIRTLRSTYWLTGLALVLPAAVAGLLAAFLPDSLWDRAPEAVGGALLVGAVMFTPLPFAALFMGMIGAFAIGHEYRHGMILSTLAALPRRSRALAAKVLMVIGWALFVAVFGVALNWVVAVLASGRGINPFSEKILPAVIGYVLYVLLWGVLGLGLTVLIRSLPVVITLLFVTPLIVEPLLQALLLFLPGLESVRDLAHYLPFGAGLALADTLGPDGVGALFGDTGAQLDGAPERWVSGLTFAGWTAGLLGLGWLFFNKRDA